MKILLIGGTGTISFAISKLLLKMGHTLYLLNRGNRVLNELEGAIFIKADINDEKEIAEKIKNLTFDCVADFIAYNSLDVERDFRLFNGKTNQYIYISSASAYQKPLETCVITEKTPLVNPFWLYSRDKIAAENFLMDCYKNKNFPITIVRPSHTYDERKVPVAIHGKKGSFQVLKRMLDGKPIIIHGDGSSLWTLTHSSDFAVGFVGLIGNQVAIGNAFHIMTEEGMSWNQIYSTIADALGVNLTAVHIASDLLCSFDNINLDLKGTLLGDKANSVRFDISKLKSVVPNFCPKVSMKQGLTSTVENILHHKELQIEDVEFDSWCDKVVKTYTSAFSFV